MEHPERLYTAAHRRKNRFGARGIGGVSDGHGDAPGAVSVLSAVVTGVGH